MIGALARKFFGSANDRRIKGYQARVNAINALEPELVALTDEQLKARTEQFRKQLAEGDTLDEILIPAFATVREAAQQMRTADIGALVVEEDGKPYGIVTDRDIAIRAVAQGLNPEVTPIASICSKDLITVSPEDHIDSALRLMREKALRRVLVVDYEKAPIGMVSLGDLAVRRDSHSVLGEISAAPPNH